MFIASKLAIGPHYIYILYMLYWIKLRSPLDWVLAIWAVSGVELCAVSKSCF